VVRWWGYEDMMGVNVSLEKRETETEDDGSYEACSYGWDVCVYINNRQFEYAGEVGCAQTQSGVKLLTKKG
jgi:hypothetical protein